MSNEKMDDKISQWMHYETKEISAAKDELWGRIESKLEPRRSKKITWLTSTAAAAVVIASISFTTPGHAAIESIKDWILPEKKIVQSIEGENEEIDAVAKTDKEMTYAIYVDKEKYVVTNENDITRIVPNLDMSAYPEVSMEIRHMIDQTPQQLLGKEQSRLKAAYEKITLVGEVTEPLKATLIKGITGAKWDSPLERVYLVADHNGGTFVIIEKFFLEAEEGHGARFSAMLKEFKVLQKNES
jgi:hypothetical protein